jgi:hypothetical protein
MSNKTSIEDIAPENNSRYIPKKDNTSTLNAFFSRCRALASSTYKQHGDEVNCKYLFARFPHSRMRESEERRCLCVCVYLWKRVKSELLNETLHINSEANQWAHLSRDENDCRWAKKWFVVVVFPSPCAEWRFASRSHPSLFQSRHGKECSRARIRLFTQLKQMPIRYALFLPYRITSKQLAIMGKPLIKYDGAGHRWENDGWIPSLTIKFNALTNRLLLTY